MQEDVDMQYSDDDYEDDEDDDMSDLSEEDSGLSDATDDEDEEDDDDDDDDDANNDVDEAMLEADSLAAKRLALNNRITREMVVNGLADVDVAQLKGQYLAFPSGSFFCACRFKDISRMQNDRWRQGRGEGIDLDIGRGLREMFQRVVTRIKHVSAKLPFSMRRNSEWLIFIACWLYPFHTTDDLLG
jgi:hypothetical protein